MPLATLATERGNSPVTLHTNPYIFENGDFFIRFSLPSTRKRRFRGPKNAGFQKRSPKIFEKPASRLNVDVGTKTEVFEYSDAIHHILPALCVLRVRHTVVLSLVLAFSCARAETIQVNVTCI